MKSSRIISAALFGVALSSQAFAGIVVDGNLADWGIVRGSTSWVPSAGTHYTVEDAKGNGSYYLSPGWGGQAYDAEAMYARIEGSSLFIALATGHNSRTLNNPAGNSFGAGDFAIDLAKTAAMSWVSTSNMRLPIAMVPTLSKLLASKAVFTRTQAGTTVCGTARGLITWPIRTRRIQLP